jgi:fructose-specific phosphotransferase system IIC component
MNELAIFAFCRINEIIVAVVFFYTQIKRNLDPHKKYFLYPIISGTVTSIGLMIYVFNHTRELLVSWNQEDLFWGIFFKSYHTYLIPMLEGLIVGMLILYLTKKKIKESIAINSE